jgi:hypothetical protein
VSVVHDQNQEVKIAEHTQGNLVTTKRGMPVYRVNPSIPPSNGLATRHKRFEVPGGKAAVIVDTECDFFRFLIHSVGGFRIA